MLIWKKYSAKLKNMFFLPYQVITESICKNISENRPSWIGSHFESFLSIFQLGTIFKWICHKKTCLYPNFEENNIKTTAPFQKWILSDLEPDYSNWAYWSLTISIKLYPALCVYSYEYQHPPPHTHTAIWIGFVCALLHTAMFPWWEWTINRIKLDLVDIVWIEINIHICYTFISILAVPNFF